MSESHSETRVLEYPSSTPFRYTKGYSRVLSVGYKDGPEALCIWPPAVLPLLFAFAFANGTHVELT